MNQSIVPRSQQGAGMWSLLFIFGVIALFALVTVKVVPIYLNQMKVASVMREIAQDPKLGPTASPREIRDILARHWAIEDIDDLQPADMAIRPGDHGPKVSYNYEARAHLFYNVFIVIHFQGGTTLRGGA